MKKLFLIFLYIVLPTELTALSKKSILRKYRAVSAQIHKLISNNPHLHIGCEVYSLKTQQVVFSENATHLFIPASTTKLLTAIVALETVGPQYKFETQLITDGTLAENQRDSSGIQENSTHTLHGNVYIQGSGDPSLTSTDMDLAIKYLSDHGITTITGNLCLDHELFDHECFAPGSFIDNLGASWNSGVSSFILDGKPLGLYVINTVSFMNSRPLQDIFFDGERFFKMILQKYGIQLEGNILFQQCPQNGTILYTHYSPPLSLLLSKMLKDSDNLYADCLFKKIGAVSYTSPGSWQKGINVVTSFLQNKTGILDNFVIKDGSGRSRYNLISPHLMVALLRWIPAQPTFTPFLESLAIAGVDGTLKERMSSIRSQVKAKTGTLSGVSALAGYVESPHDCFAFSIMINGYVSDSVYSPPCKTEIEDAICLMLATV